MQNLLGALLNALLDGQYLPCACSLGKRSLIVHWYIGFLLFLDDEWLYYLFYIFPFFLDTCQCFASLDSVKLLYYILHGVVLCSTRRTIGETFTLDVGGPHTLLRKKKGIETLIPWCRRLLLCLSWDVVEEKNIYEYQANRLWPPRYEHFKVGIYGISIKC